MTLFRDILIAKSSGPFLVLIKSEIVFGNVDPILLSLSFSTFGFCDFNSSKFFTGLFDHFCSVSSGYLFSRSSILPVLLLYVLSLAICATPRFLCSLIFSTPSPSQFLLPSSFDLESLFFLSNSYLSKWYVIHSGAQSRNVGDLLYFPFSHILYQVNH